MSYMLAVILVLVGVAAIANRGHCHVGTWARRLGADGDGDNGQVKAASVGGLLHAVTKSRKAAR
jgi:hypothetical protein